MRQDRVARTATTVNATSARSENMLLFSAFFIIIEFALFAWCTWQQLTTTHDSIYGLLQGGVMTPSNMTAQQVLAFLQNNADKYNKIAYTCAFVTQVVFLGGLLPGHGHHRTLKRIVATIFFILEVTSDLWYSSASNTTLGNAFVYIFNLGGGGWLASLTYIAAMSAGSTLVGIDVFARIQRLMRAVNS